MPSYAYHRLVPEADALAALGAETKRSIRMLAAITDVELPVVHEPYSWSVRQVIGHVIDSERIFVYRLMSIARGDRAEFPGFDENAYAAVAADDTHTVADFAHEYQSMRQSHLSLVAHLPADALKRVGRANGRDATPLDILRNVVGHERHHFSILRLRLQLTEPDE